MSNDNSKSSYQTTMTVTERCDEDGDVVTVPAVRLWDVYAQSWRVIALDSVSDEILASLPADERAAIVGA